MTRVLVVDDREDNLYLLRVLLEGSGYTVALAGNGAEALRLARETVPDLVITDLLMPVMDGYTLLRHWKADEHLRRIPVVIHTATYADPEDERLALSLGADAFVCKPAEPDVLLAALQGVLVRSAESGPAKPQQTQATSEPLEAYNRVLVRKLEQKMDELGTAHASLRGEYQERVQAEERLRESTSLLRMAGQLARLGGWSLALPERVISWSEEACRVQGLQPGTRCAIGDALDRYLPEYRTEIRERIETCIADGAAFDLEAPLNRADGHEVWLRMIGEAVRNDSGAVTRVQGAIQDISERRLLEEQILRAQRLEGIATLTSGMAHDLNNVLAPILLAASGLEEDVRDPRMRETVAAIVSCAERGSEMVRQVLSLARQDVPGRGIFDLARVLDDLQLLVRETFPRGIVLDAVVPTDVWDLVGDSTQVHQVLLNVLVNARDAMPEGGNLSVIVENVMIDDHYAAMSGEPVAGPHVRVSVMDTGVGMAPELLGRIFDPLFTTKSEGRGTGLGLSTVATIMRNHRGFVNVYSEPGVGTAFRLHFPAAPNLVQAVPASAQDEVRGNGELVLVVDDAAGVRSLTRHTLEAAGYRAITATDGVDAVGIFNQRGAEIAVVVVDMVMPVMDGGATVRALRELRPELPIVATSGFGGSGADVEARAVGGVAFLTKPYAARALLDAVHLALTRHLGQ